MCGGAERTRPEQRSEPKPEQDFTYTPPDLKSLYQTFKETGTVPYSYYGAGAPTREGELEAMRKSYPGAFTAPAPGQAPNQPAQRRRLLPEWPGRQQQSGDPMALLMQSLRGAGRS